MSLNLHSLFIKMFESDDGAATDLHITANSPPVIRLHGKLHPMDGYESLTAPQTKKIIYSVMTDQQKHMFEENLELDFSFGIKDLARFRANVFLQRGAVAAAFRVIPHEILGFDKLGLPPIIQELCEKPRGLVLVTGPTGSGKSTTLAAMIDKINRERKEHILTIEDPIEYLHSHQSCLINQREIKADTHSFANALRSALRQDPDIVLVGELRDLETTETCLKIAETGHLTFATLHTNSAAQTINRIIDIFPAHQQSQIRTQLSMVLEGVLCQTLLPHRSGKGRVLGLEVLIPTASVRNLIREDKVHQIYSAMQTGQEKSGMQTFNQCFATLYLEGKLSLETVMARSSNPEELQDMINRGVGTLRKPGGGRPARSARPSR